MKNIIILTLLLLTPFHLSADWLDDVTHYNFVTDLRTDLAEEQNIVTYVIGFTIDHPLLKDAVVNSTGEYFVANSSDELSASLHAAVASIILRASSFTAAAAPSTQHIVVSEATDTTL